MTHEIPTVPQDDPSETIMAALAHGMTGHPEKAAPLFEPFVKGGPTTTVGLCAALAEMSAFGPRKALSKGDTFGLLVLDAHTGQRGDINSLPPGIRFAAQFSTAWGNGEQDTAYALFRALVEPADEQAAEALADGIRALFDMAVVSLNEMTGRTA
ncbi:hypothetical protein OOK13_40390 [Streptomyces sp. NBC_00378]|uniref:hypothetical protein n=1 Tax=unclassified Streptomyces TaxID=2593676 RepID=UPI00225C05A0|nr:MULTISPECIES: hypothetical protein [unclassified Streptomyces]MCX5112183.1 hypothetical protein [Streptomyces sp. NBC_00378]MCX5114622.1 hypothetical protein [Streptomyces sp. NBC_00378]